MSWVIFAVLTIICYTLMDLFIKLSAGKIESGLGGLIINLASVIPPLLWVVLFKLSGQKVPHTKDGLIYSTIAGLSIGIGAICFMKMFATGVNLSIGVPFVRIGIVIAASILGVVLLKEGLSPKLLVGLILSLTGLYLLIGAK